MDASGAKSKTQITIPQDDAIMTRFTILLAIAAVILMGLIALRYFSG